MKEFKMRNPFEEFDWRDLGAVTEATQQGSCGSCWAFTTAAMMEAVNKLDGGSLTRLSPQHLVDCASNDDTGNMGCDGGHPLWTYPWLFSNKIYREADYPYLEIENGNCLQEQSMLLPGVRLKYGHGIYKHRPDQLKAALLYGPVAVTVDADSALFRDYRKGIIKSPACGESLGHAVLAIGYGKSKNKDVEYVIIKNSWGRSWGEDGFVRISLDQSYGKNGICGVLMELSIGTNQKVV